METEDDLMKQLSQLPRVDTSAHRAEEIRRVALARLARAKALAAENAALARPVTGRLRFELAAGAAFSLAQVAWALVTVLGA